MIQPLTTSIEGADRPAPTLGRDSEQVLRHLLGYDPARIAALSESGALE